MVKLNAVKSHSNTTKNMLKISHTNVYANAYLEL